MPANTPDEVTANTPDEVTANTPDEVTANPPDEQPTKWSLTPQAWDKLLKCFSADPEEASREYERARQKLIRYFEWRSVLGAEDWADEAMNRAARRIDEGQKIDKLMAYLYGVARHIYKEILRDPNQNAANVDDVDRNLPDKKPVFVDPDSRQLCFDKCLEGLSTDNHDLILEYFQGEGGAKIRGRQSIADRLEIPLNALRIRVHRIRKSLENCIADCLRQNLVRND